MKIKTSMQEDGLAKIQVIDPSDGAVSHSAVVGQGEQFTVVATSAHSPADIEVYGPEAYVAEDPVDTPAGKGSEQPDEPVEAEAPAGEGTTEPEGEAAEAGETPEGEAAPEGEQAAEPLTSAESEKPLYRVLADEAPEGFVLSGLAAPDGFALYHYEGDTAGEAHTAELGDEAGVGLYADADDDEQPVVAVEGEAGEAA